MRYSAEGSLDAVYTLIARLSEPDDPDDARLDEAMTIADGLIACGEDRSWASVWWAYAAQHYEMSDEALERALALLARVDRPAEALAERILTRRLARNGMTGGSDVIRITGAGRHASSTR